MCENQNEISVTKPMWEDSSEIYFSLNKIRLECGLRKEINDIPFHARIFLEWLRIHEMENRIETVHRTEFFRIWELRRDFAQAKTFFHVSSAE